MASGIECRVVAGHARQHVRSAPQRRTRPEHPMDPRPACLQQTTRHWDRGSPHRRSQRPGLGGGWREFHESRPQPCRTTTTQQGRPGWQICQSPWRKNVCQVSLERRRLVIDNTNICHCGPTTPIFSVYTKLAAKMGWIVLSSDHSSAFTLGPNLQQTFLKDQIPTMAPGSDWNDLTDSAGKPQFWVVNQRYYLNLSMSCSWRFTNLNTAFRSIVGEPTRTLHVYSDVAGSIMVGNRVTDLFREVMYQRKGHGSAYFEPTHIQYIPLRKEVVDIVEINVAETNGDLTKFGPGNTIVTLHFKRT